MSGLTFWKNRTVKRILMSLVTILLLVMAVLGITFWLLLYLDYKTPDNIDYEEFSQSKEEGISYGPIPSSFV